MGDLNFRLLEKTLSHDEIVHEIESSNSKVLQKHDQLKHVQNENTAFQELTESEINFPPTFKHVIGSDDYDTKRRPAWTDRILHRVNSYNLEDIGKKLIKFGSPYREEEISEVYNLINLKILMIFRYTIVPQ